MGQYHKAYNLTKKQFIHGHDIGNGLKLMEQVGFNGSTADAVWFLLANSNGRGGGDAQDHPLIGSWAGDQIVVQGDYAEPGDPGFISDEERQGYTNISASVRQMLDSVGY